MPTPPKLALPVREEDAASSPVLHIPPSGGLFSPRGTSPRAVFLFCTVWLSRVPHRCFRRARSPHLCWHGACVVCVFALVCSTFCPCDCSRALSPLYNSAHSQGRSVWISGVAAITEGGRPERSTLRDELAKAGLSLV